MKTIDPPQDTVAFVCPRTGKVIAPRPKVRWAMWLLPAAGLLSLAWFLMRVIPKPSRATYPCQRMAFPIASGFVAWLVGMTTTVVAYRKVQQFSRQHRAALAVACAAVVVIAGLHTLFNVPASPANATTVPQTPNTPVGVAKGVYPGRVVWVHDRKAVSYAGPYVWGTSDHWWFATHNNQAAIDGMMSISLRNLTDTNSDEAAWDSIFRYHNSTHGHGNVGYTAGEKINIMPNMVAQSKNRTSSINQVTYDQTGDALNDMSVSPWLLLSLLRQLVNKAGVPQNCISIGQSVCYFPNQFYTPCHNEFPDIVYLDCAGWGGPQYPRTKFVASTHKFYWSKPGVNPTNQDYIPQPNVDATYFIDIANLKAHEGGGISQCGKCYYGSLLRMPSDSGYYELHGDLPWTSGTSGFGHYRTLVDLMAHSDFGYGKGLLWIQDWMWGGIDAGTRPFRWTISPFNNDWPNSLVVSQDPVATDSVGLDFCRAQTFPNNYPTNVTAADDYLHEAATINDPPSGIFYDPDHPQTPPENRVRRSSLGVHEHWNNNTNRQYSRNLSPSGTGIELLWLDVGDPGDADRNKTVNTNDIQAVASGFAKVRGQTGFVQNTDLTFDGRIDISDLLQVASNFGTTYP